MMSQLPGTNPRGLTERAKRANERVIRAFLAAGDLEAEVSAQLLGRAILDDSDCHAVAVLEALGVDVARVAESGGDTPRTRQAGGDVMMIKFAPAVSMAMQAANEHAIALDRPTGTGDMLLGLLEADPAWRDRLGIQPDDFRSALAAAASEE